MGGNLSFPRYLQQINELWCTGEINVGQLTKAFEIIHTLTLHAIDCQKYHVASLMDDSIMEDLNYNSDEENIISKFQLYYRSQLPTLWGILPKSSPLCFYRKKLTDCEFKNYIYGDRDDWEDEDDRAPLEYMPIRAMLQLDTWGIDDDGEYAIDLYHTHKGVNFSFRGSEGESSVQMSHQICSFLRALMQERCLPIEPRVSLGTATVKQQPEWVRTEKILNTITSYVSFEVKVGKLRLVCRQFDAAVLRQLEDKLDEAKVIGFSRDGEGGGDSWFKATVRRGWSDNCLTSKESAIDDALWLASCRCCFDYCPDKESCSYARKPLECRGYSAKCKKDEIQTIDVAWARQTLSVKGSVYLTDEDPYDLSYEGDYCAPRSNGVQCSFQEYELHFELCRIVEKGFGPYMDQRMYDGGLVSLHRQLKEDYGVTGRITSRRFVRSIFLVLARAKGMPLATDESAEKKARSTPSEEVTVGEAKSNISVKNGYFSRSKKIYRFFSLLIINQWRFVLSLEAVQSTELLLLPSCFYNFTIPSTSNIHDRNNLQ